MKKGFIVKLVLSLVLLIFLLGQIDLSLMVRVLSSAKLSDLTVVLTGYLISQIVSCGRWALLTRPLGFALPFRDYLSFYFIGMFFNLFAPSTVGGDASRVFYLAQGGKPHEAQRGRRTTAASISVLTDRAVGVGVLVWIGAAAMIRFPAYGMPQIIRYLTYACSVAFIAGWLSLSLVNRVLSWRGSSLGEYVRLSLDAYWTNQTVILYAIALSVVIHLIQSGMHVFLGRALGLEIPWSYALILYPLVGLFSALPVSVNGIGLRENGYLFFLKHVGVSSENAVAFGLLWFLIVALDSLIGGVVYVLRKSPHSAETALGEDVHAR